MGFERDTELSLWCTDDVEMARLNAAWRGRTSTTDVLSFPQWDAAQHGVLTPKKLLGRPAVLGDVAISMPVAQRQAVVLGHSLEAEMRRLLVHGVLHLLGHDHVEGGNQARRMRRAENNLLKSLEQVPEGRS